MELFVLCLEADHEGGEPCGIYATLEEAKAAAVEHFKPLLYGDRFEIYRYTLGEYEHPRDSIWTLRSRGHLVDSSPD